tara:strand:+ start:9857 stop:10579 length:723 start_codon:yes stop_codon:yes gene_type:complete
MGTKEQIVMWGSVLLVIIVIGLIVTSGGENNYLNPSGNRNPANQKLMVVDQDTGEISFIQKSLQGVNEQIVADDSVILNILKELTGDNLNNYGGYTKGSDAAGVLAKISHQIETIGGKVNKLDGHMKTILGNDYSGTAAGHQQKHIDSTKHIGNEGILGRLRKKLDDVDYWHYTNEIRNGHRIGIKVVNPAGKNVGDSGAGGDRDHWLNDQGCDNRYGHNDKASWCIDNAADRMYIHSME